MKNFYTTTLNILLLLLSINCFSQVGIGTTTPNPSSVLDITSTTAGLLAPRMTQVQKNAIAAPATGLLIYQTDATAGFYYYNGSAWMPFGSSGWAVTGNSGTVPATNFLGTTDAQDLVIKANNAEAIRVQSGGNIGIGTNAPSTKLHIVGSTASTLLSDGFEDSTIAPFATSGAGGNWTVTSAAGEFNSGTKGIKSSGGVNSSVSDLTYTTSSVPASGGNVSFALKTASESAYDFLIFYIDGVEQSRWSGATAWTTVSYTLTSGVHNLKWTYLKDSSTHDAIDRVYIDTVLITSPGSGIVRIVDGLESAGKVLTSDASGNASWQTASNAYTFTNGITNTSGIVKLGGTLIESTTIAATSFPLNVSSLNKPYMLHVDNDEDVVKFGHDGSLSGEGVTHNIDGTDVIVKYVTSAKNGDTHGTAVGVGSIEYLVDGEAIIASSFGIAPTATNTYNLGTNTSRWKNIYLQNAPIVTSDITLKKNIKGLNYGLKEIMKLNPISYQWKNDYIGKTFIPENQRQTSLGFSAQELLTILPEVVKTHDWKIISEETPDQYQYLKNDKLGVMYSQIIPVTVKAIQEQQIEIETLKIAVAELKKQNELLFQLINKK